MDANADWQAFACTGNIYRYLDYKQQKEEPACAKRAEEGQDGTICDAGACPERNTL